MSLFVPEETDTPIPLEYLDIMRTTVTDLEAHESFIEDHWIGQSQGDVEPDRELSSWWVGTTQFPLRQTVPPPQMTWVMGRLTKIQKSNRPPNIYPEQWTTMSPKNQAKAIRDVCVPNPVLVPRFSSRRLP